MRDFYVDLERRPTVLVNILLKTFNMVWVTGHETWPELADCFLAAFDWFGGGEDS